jgi:hypothetical protein
MVNKFFHYFSVKADKKAEVERTIKSEQERIVICSCLDIAEILLKLFDKYKHIKILQENALKLNENKEISNF